MADEVTTTEAAATATTDTGATNAPVDEWADPEPLADGVDQFDRKYVESLRDREAKYRIKARDLSKTLDEFGGLDPVRQAVELQRQLATDDGVVSMFIETGKALGLGIKELEALFEEAQAEHDANAPDPDAPLTRAELEAALAERVDKPAQQRAQEIAMANAQNAVDSALSKLGFTQGDEKDAEKIETILLLGQKYIADGDFDPAHIRAAVEKGHADYAKLTAKEAQEYVDGKRQTAATVPSSTGANTSGGAALPEPVDMAEAKRRARQRLRGEAVTAG